MPLRVESTDFGGRKGPKLRGTVPPPFYGSLVSAVESVSRSQFRAGSPAFKQTISRASLTKLKRSLSAKDDCMNVWIANLSTVQYVYMRLGDPYDRAARIR